MKRVAVMSVALLAAAAAKNLHSSTIRCFVFVLAAMLSHSILDAFTTGGLGVAFLWPWSSERFFAPVRMIRVSPMHAGQLWSPRGLAVLYSELRWVWLPCLGIALIATATRTFCRSSQNSSTTA